MDWKKFTQDAGTFFNRAKQFTEEKLGQAEKTELDAHFENLQQRADRTKVWTDKIIKQTEAVLQPNPSLRVEGIFYEKLDKKKPARLTNYELLGQYMNDAGNDFGPGTNYGAALVKCGLSQQKLGVAEKEFVSASANHFLMPIKNFMDGDMKTITKERKALETKRLDLDACKNKVRRAKSQEANSKSSPVDVEKAEAELRIAQCEFDRQYEITKLLLEGISSAHVNHLRCLKDFVDAQQVYFQQCLEYTNELRGQLNSPNIPGGGAVGPSAPPATPAASVGLSDTGTASSATIVTRRARVLYDYDAADDKELSLLADEIIGVYSLPGLDSDWTMAERGTQKGRVPVTYLEMLD